jgi:hypothetical protein
MKSNFTVFRMTKSSCTFFKLTAVNYTVAVRKKNIITIFLTQANQHAYDQVDSTDLRASSNLI